DTFISKDRPRRKRSIQEILWIGGEQLDYLKVALFIFSCVQRFSLIGNQLMCLFFLRINFIWQQWSVKHHYPFSSSFDSSLCSATASFFLTVISTVSFFSATCTST